MTKQLRRTAGFLLRAGDTLLHIDPGPGALVYLNKLGADPSSLSGVVVTHNHLDHANDAAVLVEGMTDGGRKKRGVFLGSKYVLEGSKDGNFSPALSAYHKQMPAVCNAVTPGDETYVGNVRLKFTPTWHDEPTGVGVLVDDGKVRLAYLSDTGYRDDIAKQYADFRPHIAIFNLIFDSEEIVPHTTTKSVKLFLEAYTPKLVLLQHFGAKITLKRSEQIIAKKLSEEFGVEVRPLRDGDTIEFPREPKGLERYI